MDCSEYRAVYNPWKVYVRELIRWPKLSGCRCAFDVTPDVVCTDVHNALSTITALHFSGIRLTASHGTSGIDARSMNDGPLNSRKYDSRGRKFSWLLAIFSHQRSPSLDQISMTIAIRPFVLIFILFYWPPKLQSSVTEKRNNAKIDSHTMLVSSIHFRE